MVDATEWFLQDEIKCHKNLLKEFKFFMQLYFVLS